MQVTNIQSIELSENHIFNPDTTKVGQVGSSHIFICDINGDGFKVELWNSPIHGVNDLDSYCVIMRRWDGEVSGSGESITEAMKEAYHEYIRTKLWTSG